MTEGKVKLTDAQRRVLQAMTEGRELVSNAVQTRFWLRTNPGFASQSSAFRDPVWVPTAVKLMSAGLIQKSGPLVGRKFTYTLTEAGRTRLTGAQP